MGSYRIAIMIVHDENCNRSDKVLLSSEEVLIQACVVQENFMEEGIFALSLDK